MRSLMVSANLSGTRCLKESQVEKQHCMDSAKRRRVQSQVLWTWTNNIRDQAFERLAESIIQSVADITCILLHPSL